MINQGSAFNNFISQVKDMLHAFAQSFSVTLRKDVIGYYLIPIAAYLLLFFIAWFFSATASDFLKDWVIGKLKDTPFYQNNSGWLANAIKLIFLIIVKVLVVMLYYYIVTFLILIIMSPFLSLVAEKTILIKTGMSTPFSMRKLFKDAYRGVLMVTRNFLIQFLVLILIGILAFVPVISIFTSIIGVVANCYFLGFSFMDYTFEQQGYTIKESRVIVKKNKFAAVFIGAVFYIMALVPIIGGLLSSFSVILLTSAACLYLIKRDFGKKDLSTGFLQ